MLALLAELAKKNKRLKDWSLGVLGIRSSSGDIKESIVLIGQIVSAGDLWLSGLHRRDIKL